MICCPTASRSGLGRTARPTAATRVWIAALVLLEALLVAAAGPALASGPLPGAVIQIPGDYPVPEPGARVVVPVPPGGQVQLDPDALDLVAVELSLEGADLILRLGDGAEFALQDFFASVEPPAAIVVRDATLPAGLILSEVASALAGGRTLTLVDVYAASQPTETAAGPAGGGGGEMFGLLQVVSWLVDRLDVVSDAQAAESPQLAQGAGSSLLGQLEAQLLIAREGEIARLAAAHQSATASILSEITSRVDSGFGSAADLFQARVFDLDAQLEAKDAAFRLLLAVDAHQDAYGERLETAAFPAWSAAPPDDLAAITAGLPPETQSAARRHWRQARHARETVTLLDTLTTVATELHDAYRQQFDVGQRSLGELGSAENTLYQAQVRLVQRRYDLVAAEAWLLAVKGQLPADVIKHPGWQ